MPRIVPIGNVAYEAWENTAGRRAAKRRRIRLEIARAKGTHTKTEWAVLHDLFGRCVACGIPYEMLFGGSATKDHIMPITCGGCDCIGNLQPVCRQCNTRGVFDDMREAALPGWQTIYLHRMGAFF